MPETNVLTRESLSPHALLLFPLPYPHHPAILLYILVLTSPSSPWQDYNSRYSLKKCYFHSQDGPIQDKCGRCHQNRLHPPFLLQDRSAGTQAHVVCQDSWWDPSGKTGELLQGSGELIAQIIVSAHGVGPISLTQQAPLVLSSTGGVVRFLPSSDAPWALSNDQSHAGPQRRSVGRSMLWDRQ